MLHRVLLGTLIPFLLSSAAEAHYLWVNIDREVGPNGSARIIFEEGPAAGDGHYLDPILATSRVRVRTIDEPGGKIVSVSDIRKEKLRWLQTPPLNWAAPRSIDAYAKFGVYRYGQKDVLLHYYARILDLNAHEDLHELGRADQMKLDVVPHDFGNRVTLTVIWEGNPVAGRKVFIQGPKGFRRNLTTDADGNVAFTVENPGQFQFRSSVEFNEAGTDGGKAYSQIRHHATLQIQLPLAE